MKIDGRSKHFCEHGWMIDFLLYLIHKINKLENLLEANSTIALATGKE